MSVCSVMKRHISWYDTSKMVILDWKDGPVMLSISSDARLILDSVSQAGYLLGVPVSAYSLDIGKAHTDFAESKLQQRLIERQLTDDEVNQLAVISMAGIAGEARKYEEVGSSGILALHLVFGI